MVLKGKVIQKTGLFIKSFPVFDAIKNSFMVDSVVWFEFNGDEVMLETIDKFSFDNGKIMSKSPPDIKVVNGKIFAKYNVTKVNQDLPIEFLNFDKCKKVFGVSSLALANIANPAEKNIKYR